VATTEIKAFCLPSTFLTSRDQTHTDAHWCLWPVYSGLKYYSDTARRLKKKRRKDVIPVIERTRFDATGGIHDDTWRTIQMAGVLHQAIRQQPGTVPYDEITRGVEVMLESPTVPVWLTFGMQVLLDVQDILHATHSWTPFEDLHICMAAEILAQKALHDNWLLPFIMTSSASSEPSQTLDDMRKLNTMRLLRHKYLANGTSDALKHNPIRCGLLKYDLYLDRRGQGLPLEEATNQICMMAHLYVATRTLHPEAPKWPDMELAIHHQNPTRLFFGGIPKTIDECMRKVYDMAGKSATSMARDAGRRQKMQAKDSLSGIFFGKVTREKTTEGRRIEDTSTLATIFHNRNARSSIDGLVDLQVKVLGNKIRSTAELAHLARKVGSSPKHLEAELQWHSGKDNGPTALLRELSLWIDGDAIDLYFDWHALHDQCARIWDRLVHSLSDDPAWNPQWSRSINMGIYIIDRASLAAKEVAYVGMDDLGFVPLRKAHEAIQNTIFERQAEPTDDLGTHDASAGITKMHTRGGDVCITRLLKEVEDFAVVLSGDECNVHKIYETWPADKIGDSRVVESCSNPIQAWQELAMIERQHNPEAEECDHRAKCLICRRRDVLGHRYPQERDSDMCLGVHGRVV
jgi:hypothetical protein